MSTSSVPVLSDGSHLEAALAYAHRGWHVLRLHSIDDEGRCTCGKADCSSPGKHPSTRHGVKDATTDEATIRGWWAEHPDANVGIRTGPESGIFGIGPDGQAGIDALAELERQHGPLPPTPTVRSGGGGRHLYYAWPSDGDFTIAANCNGVPIDVRGRNGYFVAPPSKHASGKRYVWVEDCPVSPATPWLLDWVKAAKTSRGPNSTIHTNGVVLTVVDDDLRHAPGACKGQRHEELWRLVGHHLQRGDDLVQIEQWALQWATTCVPPLPSAEVIPHVRRLQQKHARGSSPSISPSIASTDIESLPLPAALPRPVLAPKALYGLAGDCVRRIEPCTESDPVALLVQLLVYFGNAIGRSAYAIVEVDKHFTNLFACLVGVTAHGRKGSSAGRVKALFRGAEPEWLDARLLTGLNTGQGLVHAVRDSVTEAEVTDDGELQVVVKDAGVDDKRLLAEEQEFAKVLKHLRQETSILSATLREAWDSGDLRNLTKTSPDRSTGAHISIVAHSTPEELRRFLTETEVSNGFSNRFIWTSVRRSKLLPEGGVPVDVDDLVHRLKEAIAFAKQVEFMYRDAEATQLWRQEYPRLTHGRPGLFGAVTTRAEAQVLRLSLIYALLDKSSTVCKEHLEAALAVWDYCEASARYIFGDSSGDKLADRLLELVKAKPGITRTELHRALSGHVDATAMLQALGKLQEAGFIRREFQQTAGRPREHWYACLGQACEVSGESAGSPQTADLSSHDSLSPPGDSVTATGQEAPAVVGVGMADVAAVREEVVL